MGSWSGRGAGGDNSAMEGRARAKVDVLGLDEWDGGVRMEGEVEVVYADVCVAE